jgi:hypothetical protein
VALRFSPLAGILRQPLRVALRPALWAFELQDVPERGPIYEHPHATVSTSKHMITLRAVAAVALMFLFQRGFYPIKETDYPSRVDSIVPFIPTALS